MDRPVRFLVVEFPSRQFIFTRFTKDHPLSTIDVVLDPPRQRGAVRLHPARFLVKGTAWRELRILLDELEATHEPPQILQRDPSGLAWVCRVEFHEERLGTDGQALRALQDRFGPPWLHHEQGVCHMRALLPEGANAQVLVDQMAAFLRQTGVEAQVDAVDMGPRDYGVWEDLLQARSGLP